MVDPRHVDYPIYRGWNNPVPPKTGDPLRRGLRRRNIRVLNVQVRDSTFTRAAALVSIYPEGLRVNPPRRWSLGRGLSPEEQVPLLTTADEEAGLPSRVRVEARCSRRGGVCGEG